MGTCPYLTLDSRVRHTGSPAGPEDGLTKCPPVELWGTAWSLLFTPGRSAFPFTSRVNDMAFESRLLPHWRAESREP